MAILELGRLGLDTATAVLVVSLFRLTSTGAALAVGAIFLVRELRDAAVGVAGPAEGTAHFDQMAEQYNAQWSPHVWDLLLNRKVGFMAEALPEPPAAGVGLDLGCGLGLQTAEMRRRGYNVIGLDPSVGAARRRAATARAFARDLGVRARAAVRRRVPRLRVRHRCAASPPRPRRAAHRAPGNRRVLRPGGRFLVHESNPRNPLFRFYMGYLFPILKRIDEGTEWWIDPRHWEGVSGLRLERVRYFTFLPDFTPRVFMKPAVLFERLLERGPTRTYSAHYMAVLRRAAMVVLAMAGLLGASRGEAQGAASVTLTPGYDFAPGLTPGAAHGTRA